MMSIQNVPQIPFDDHKNHMTISEDFKDILAPRRANRDAVGFMTRHWVGQEAYRVPKKMTPAELKTFTAKSERLNKLLDELSVILKRSKADLMKEVITMLDEIGLDRKMYVVRWLGIFTTKVLCRLCSSIFVNERSLFHVKSNLGHNPVVFVPSHRSYGDFILMTYISFYYDIELPSVAAGMDFYAMVGMGRIMRDTGAFYIRRTFASDKLYGTVFRQYVRTLITNHFTPLEFFIEGTRSRSSKSMAPKYGFMSMVLEPLFAREIPDITFIPINITYDRILEEKLFAFELLGVPKPKESTSGLIKALNILNDHLGNIYVNIGKPISAKEYFGSSMKRTMHVIKPVESQVLSPEENKLVQNISHEIVYRQQRYAFVTTFQMIAVSVMMSLHKSQPLLEADLFKEIVWLANLFKNYDGNVFEYEEGSWKTEFKDVFQAHCNLVRIDKANKLRLISDAPVILTSDIQNKMKGHKLSQKTMSDILPVMLLQLYVNATLHWILPSSVICLILKQGSYSKEELWEMYRKLRYLLQYEFPINEPTAENEFENHLKVLKNNSVIKSAEVLSDNKITLGSNNQQSNLFINLIWPFMCCVRTLTEILSSEQVVNEKDIIITAQKTLEKKLLNESSVHPYSLALDCISNCVQGLAVIKALTKERTEKTVIYHVNQSIMNDTRDWVKKLTPDMKVTFNYNNPVMMGYNYSAHL